MTWTDPDYDWSSTRDTNIGVSTIRPSPYLRDT